MIMNMRKTLLLIAIGIALIVAATTARSKTLTAALDLSGSNPLISDPNFAHGAAAYLHKEIAQLKAGDTVRLVTLGSRQASQNLRYQEIVLGRRSRPNDVANTIAEIIRSLPAHAAAHQQSATNLLAFLEFTGGFGCADKGRLVVLTDGLESSSLISGEDLATGKKPLPKPDVDLSGCHITFYGLGAGWQPQTVKTVRKAWQSWSDAAGATFDAVIK